MRTFPRESPGNENFPGRQPATRTFTRASPGGDSFPENSSDSKILSKSVIRKLETPYVPYDEIPSNSIAPSLRIEETVQRPIPTPHARHETPPPLHHRTSTTKSSIQRNCHQREQEDAKQNAIYSPPSADYGRNDIFERKRCWRRKGTIFPFQFSPLIPFPLVLVLRELESRARPPILKRGRIEEVRNSSPTILRKRTFFSGES